MFWSFMVRLLVAFCFVMSIAIWADHVKTHPKEIAIPAQIHDPMRPPPNRVAPDYIQSPAAQHLAEVFPRISGFLTTLSPTHPTVLNNANACPNNPSGKVAVRLVSGIGFWLPNDHFSLQTYNANNERLPELEPKNGFPVGCKENPYLLLRINLTYDVLTIINDLFAKDTIAENAFIAQGFHLDGLHFQYLHGEDNANQAGTIERHRHDAIQTNFFQTQQRALEKDPNAPPRHC